MDDLTNYIIVTRNPTSGKLVIVMDDSDNVAEFEAEHEALDAASNTTICMAWGYELVEVAAPAHS